MPSRYPFWQGRAGRTYIEEKLLPVISAEIGSVRTCEIDENDLLLPHYYLKRIVNLVFKRVM